MVFWFVPKYKLDSRRSLEFSEQRLVLKIEPNQNTPVSVVNNLKTEHKICRMTSPRLQRRNIKSDNVDVAIACVLCEKLILSATCILSDYKK